MGSKKCFFSRRILLDRVIRSLIRSNFEMVSDIQKNYNNWIGFPYPFNLWNIFRRIMTIFSLHLFNNCTCIMLLVHDNWILNWFNCKAQIKAKECFKGSLDSENTQCQHSTLMEFWQQYVSRSYKISTTILSYSETIKWQKNSDA